MADTNDGGQAFPVLHQQDANGEVRQWGEPGMTLRDYFAAKAMPAVMQMISVGMHEPAPNEPPVSQRDFIAQSAYEVADAMLKARQA